MADRAPDPVLLKLFWLLLVSVSIVAPITAGNGLHRSLHSALAPSIPHVGHAEATAASATSAAASDASLPAQPSSSSLQKPLMSSPLRPLIAQQTRSVGCPSIKAAVSAPGCPCTMHSAAGSKVSSGELRDTSLTYMDSTASGKGCRYCNVCPAGHRCSPSAAAAVVSAGWNYTGPAINGSSARNSSNTSSMFGLDGVLGAAGAHRGICVPCQLGEYCPEGTQEETWLSLVACELDPMSSSPVAAGRTNSSSLGIAGKPADASLSHCKGFKACPAGSYCPDTATATSCEPGRYCPEGSITSQPCNITGLLVWNPFRSVQTDPQSLMENLVNSGQSLAGNSCPANTTNPLGGCPAGYYCPTAAQKIECPIAYFCPGHTTAPIPCPALASCWNKGLQSPDWSWLGLFFMLLLVVALLTILEYIRVTGRRQFQAGQQEEEVMQLIGAVGFKMVTTEVGEMKRVSMQRVSVTAAQPPALHRQLTRANRVAQASLSSGRWLLATCWKQLKAALCCCKATHLRLRNKSTHATAFSKNVDGPWHNGVDGKQAAAVTDPPNGSKHTVVTIEEPQRQQEEEEAASEDLDNSTVQGDGEYVINPRLTIVFRDVWVADRSMDKGMAQWLISTAQGLCQGSRGSTSVDSLEGKEEVHVRSAAEARLDAAAAAGVKFIVPGVSGRFAHSQLHAIMGPSGCGKTTLCKALAGRLPTSRFSADIRVLCSSAADGFATSSELAMAGSWSACAVACNISHMMGFVPQFDLLHETLTVLENLMQAACLRLPVSRSGGKGWRKQRFREVKTVVGEVVALLALNKVVHQVVGASSSRMLSGGQRKRVAIGVELVAKPSMLLLDEPTSGLDAAVAYDVVEALKHSSERGMNVLAVMHQPRWSIFNLFDSCLLLSSNGHVVYAGPQSLALHYMAFLGFYISPGENVADFLMDVIAGVIPRPGDPDYIPFQLATLWQKCGAIWLQQHTQQQQQQDSSQILGQGGLLSNSLMSLPTPAATGPVDWPWRPRDLEALLSRFQLLVDTGRSRTPRNEGLTFDASGEHSTPDGSVLSYEGFLGFWDEAGVKDMLGEEQFEEFIAGICEDFGMAPGKSITQAQFLEVLKAQLRAAAGVPAEPLPALAQDTTGPGSSVQHADLDDLAGLPAATDSREPASRASSSPSPFAAYSEASLGGFLASPAAGAVAPTGKQAPAGGAGFGQEQSAAAEEAGETGSGAEAETCAAVAELQAAVRELAEIAKEQPCATTAALAEASEACAAAGDSPAAAELCQAAKLLKAAAGSEGPCAVAAASELHRAGEAVAGETEGRDEGDRAPPRPTPPHSRTVSVASLSRATSGTYNGQVCQPGMLTCSAARMQQRQLMRQHSKRATGGTVAASARAVPGDRPVSQQQVQSAAEAVARFKRAKNALLESSKQCAGQRQLQQARLMRTVSGTTGLPEMPARVCGSVSEARTKCLNTLGDFILVQHMQKELLHQQQQPELYGSLKSTPLESVREASAVEVPPASAAVADASVQGPAAAGGARDEDVAGGGKDPSSPECSPECISYAAQAALAAVQSRQLPSVLQQTRMIMKRSARKLVSCRHMLMADLLLTSVLGLALGVAQGRSNEPGTAMLWMLITLLAYGCLMLTRSTHTYGLERHIYLQLENQGGVAVTAWVFGHHLFDLIGLLLHPALFFAWMYVLTLTPVPAWSYYIVLLVVGYYTSGLGYLVSVWVAPRNVMLTGLAIALLLGGVANGVAPRIWTLDSTHPLLWLDGLSYTRWGLQALYISWLTPSPAEKAPATAAFLSGLGFCGLSPKLLQEMQQGTNSGGAGASGFNVSSSAPNGRQWWNMNTGERANAMAEVAAENLRNATPATRHSAAAAATVTQLWQYYNHPDLLTRDCHHQRIRAYTVMVGMGLVCRLLLWVVVKMKTHQKAQE